MKKIISILMLISLLLTMQPVVVSAKTFKKMDVCNETNGDHSGDYYDGKCTKDGKPSETTTKKEETTTSTGVVSSNEEEYKFKHKLKNPEIKLHHVPFWLDTTKRNKTKDEQLCKIGSVFKYVNILGEEVTYYPEGCQEDTDIEEETEVDELENDELEEFDDLFNGMLSEDEEVTSTGETETGTIEDSSSEDEEDVSDDEVEDIFEDLFSLKGKELAPTIKEFATNKLKAKVAKINVAFVKGENEYNEEMAYLLNHVNNEFKIESIKNDFAKNISNLSYSYYTYKNTKNPRVKKVFKEKLKRDISKLKRKYKKLKFKDMIISRTLEARISEI